jgi:outer membrane lipoprotein-sorting protein
VQQNPFTSIPEQNDYVLLPTALLDDQPAYVLERTEKISDLVAIMTFYVDKATYRIKRIASVVPGKEGTTRFTVTFKSEKLNEKIPDRLFKFTPPPGTKESKDGGLIAQNPAVMLLFGMMGGMGGNSRKE